MLLSQHLVKEADHGRSSLQARWRRTQSLKKEHKLKGRQSAGVAAYGEGEASRQTQAWVQTDVRDEPNRRQQHFRAQHDPTKWSIAEG